MKIQKNRLSRRCVILLGMIASLTLVVVCKYRPTVAAEMLPDVLIKRVPHIRQKPDFCGEACVAMYLKKLGHSSDQDYVFDQSGLDPLLGRGCHTRELAKALNRLEFRTGPVWYRVNSGRSQQELDRLFEQMHRDLRQGVPSIVCMHYDDQAVTTEHFRLILGYDQETDEVIYHEPAIENGEYKRMSRLRFLKLWPLKYDARQWTVIRFRLESIATSLPRLKQGFTDADYAQHVRTLKTKLPNDKFHIVLQKPFVVIGDESAERVKERTRRTIKWAVDRVNVEYFQKDPDQIIDIWLFKDKASYETHTTELFGSKPNTPFGYYSPRHRSLVMNISTGGGTLVHEIVHPFMASNFPQCPAWFNEGLASLYEQSQDNNGRIWGLTNWRLRGLQTAISSKRVPSFQQLCETTTNEFYREDPGTNYSQARYLCYYLQEHGKLQAFYKQFRETAHLDPTGYSALMATLGEKDMKAFQKRWETYVSKLRF